MRQSPRRVRLTHISDSVQRDVCAQHIDAATDSDSERTARRTSASIIYGFIKPSISTTLSNTVPLSVNARAATAFAPSDSTCDPLVQSLPAQLSSVPRTLCSPTATLTWPSAAPAAGAASDPIAVIASRVHSSASSAYASAEPLRPASTLYEESLEAPVASHSVPVSAKHTVLAKVGPQQQASLSQSQSQDSSSAAAADVSSSASPSAGASPEHCEHPEKSAQPAAMSFLTDEEALVRAVASPPASAPASVTKPELFSFIDDEPDARRAALLRGLSAPHPHPHQQPHPGPSQQQPLLPSLPPPQAEVQAEADAPKRERSMKATQQRPSSLPPPPPDAAQQVPLSSTAPRAYAQQHPGDARPAPQQVPVPVLPHALLHHQPVPGAGTSTSAQPGAQKVKSPDEITQRLEALGFQRISASSSPSKSPAAHPRELSSPPPPAPTTEPTAGRVPSSFVFSFVFCHHFRQFRSRDFNESPFIQ